MVGPEVVAAVAATFESMEGTGVPLAERMILAMEAGQNKGGDRRFGNLQSAAIKIADPNDPGRGGDHIALAIEVGEHAEPVGEMKRIYYTTGRRLGYRTFSKIEGQDVVELKRMLHTLGYWRPSLATFPSAPPNANSPKMQELRKSDPAAYEKALAEAKQASASYTREYAVFDDEAIAAVDKFRADEEPQLPGQSAGPRRSAFRGRAEGGVSRETEIEQPVLATPFVPGPVTAVTSSGRLAVALLTGALFLVTLRPDVGGTEDSPKFQFLGQVLGTAHTPGYPFYTIATYAVHARAIRHARLSRQPVLGGVRRASRAC